MKCRWNRKEADRLRKTGSRVGLTRLDAGPVWSTGTQKGITEKTENQKTQKTQYNHAQTIPELA